MTDEITGAPKHQDTQSLLAAARAALNLGQARLAIHLYSAAFEMGSNQGTQATDELVEGLRISLNLALEMGDRPTAETVFKELQSFNSEDQNAIDLLRLQDLGPQAAETAIVEVDAATLESSAEDIAQALTEATEGIDFSQWIKSFRSALGLDGDDADEASEPGPNLLLLPPGVAGPLAKRPEGGDALEHPGPSRRDVGPPRRERPEHHGWRLDYSHIVGYRRALDQMRSFGFYRHDEVEQHRFAERVANLHGVNRLSLSQPFLFSGPDFNDVSFFAHATATEIGWPVMNIHVEVDERGSGTIKISGPFRHRFFGAPPDLSELTTPCTVLLEDIGALQQIFQFEQRHTGSGGYGPGPGGFGVPQGPGGQGGPGPWEGGFRRSVRTEFGGYLRDLINKPGVFFMATCRDDFEMDDYTYDIVGGMHEIVIDHPNADERRAVWERLKMEHASMQGLDTEALVEFSEEVPRTSLFGVTHQALDEAYRASLTSGRYQPVRLSDILTGLGSYVDEESEAYQRLEDAAAVEFLHDLDEGGINLT